MKLASHNTLSYLSPRKFYLKPFKFIARCQSKTIEEQYSNYDIRFFDFISINVAATTINSDVISRSITFLVLRYSKY